MLSIVFKEVGIPDNNVVSTNIVFACLEFLTASSLLPNFFFQDLAQSYSSMSFIGLNQAESTTSLESLHPSNPPLNISLALCFPLSS